MRHLKYLNGPWVKGPRLLLCGPKKQNRPARWMVPGPGASQRIFVAALRRLPPEGALALLLEHGTANHSGDSFSGLSAWILLASSIPGTPTIQDEQSASIPRYLSVLPGELRSLPGAIARGPKQEAWRLSPRRTCLLSGIKVKWSGAKERKRQQPPPPGQGGRSPAGEELVQRLLPGLSPALPRPRGMPFAGCEV